MDKTPEALNLSFLLDHEREMILNVLQKDDKLRKLEEKRVRKLKNELQDIKHSGAQHLPEASERQCGRCQKSLGLIFDRGELCEECGQRVCEACCVSPAAGRWRCSVCAKILQLKVVTGEWFLEERSKRFSPGSILSSDVVKQSILYCPPGDGKADNGTIRSDEQERVDTPQSSRSAPQSSRSTPQNAPDMAKRKGVDLDKRNSRPALRVGSDWDSRARTGSAPDLGAHSACRRSSTPQSCRGHYAAMETSELPTVPNSLRSKTIGRSSSPSKHSTDLGCSRRVRNWVHSLEHSWPDGAESTAGSHGSDGILNSMVTMHCKTESGTPAIAVSKDSLASDRRQPEVDLGGPGAGGPGAGPSDGTLSLRCRSVPGELNDGEYADNETAEDADALTLAHSAAADRSVTSALSMHTPPSSERKWSHLNVPDSDAETSSLNSMMSIYSEAGDHGNASISGEILLHITYSYRTGVLNILVKECRNLAIGDNRKQRTDPYVKVYLLPDKSRHSKRKTSIKSNTISPVFNETLKYVISRCQLETRTLQLSVWHSDRFGRNCFLGEAEVPFDSWDFESQVEEWFSLQPKVVRAVDPVLQYKGELTVVLRYIPAEKNLMLPLDQVQEKKSFLKGKKKSFKLPKGGMVELLVREAKNLTAVKFGGTSDTFVKGYLLPDNNKSTKHKTAVVRKTVNPQWNHTFTYCGLQPGDLNNVCLELTVWDKESLSSNVFLGGIRLGAGTGQSYGKDVDWMDSYGEERRLWQRMVDNPEVPHECTLMLRSSMEKHNP
ncbi:synaptotagmin-like protein 5 isoform X2 [Anguilla rostrata]|uniref:synaptotagmin-like protein 5 isoform X2 n=1 Tax=Anguilla rostrata TaxID=7938 RepID=UPI0030CB9F93